MRQQQTPASGPKQTAFMGYLIREIPGYGWTISREGFHVGTERSEQQARAVIEQIAG